MTDYQIVVLRRTLKCRGEKIMLVCFLLNFTVKTMKAKMSMIVRSLVKSV